MELALLGSLIYLGKNFNNKDKESDVNHDHKVKLIYNNSEEKLVKKKEEELGKIVEDSKNPIKNNIINNSINPVNNISLSYKDMNSKFYEKNKKMLKDSEMFESFNNNLSYESQFRPLTFDNVSNPVSFNKSHNSTDKDKKISIERDLAIGNGYSYIDSNMNYGVTNDDELTHDNMVPHFSKKQIINDYNEQTFAHRMELFSGSSKNFTPKKELLKENFSPLQKDVNLVNGSQNNIELLKGYYLPSTEKRNILPFEQQQIGPGLNLDPSQTSRPDGGSFEEYRPMPKTIDELRSDDNPKITFEGVMKSGQKGSKSGMIGQVYKRKPEKTRELKIDDLQKMGGEFKKEKSRDKVILKETGRETSEMLIGGAKYQHDNVSKKNDSKVKESKKKENYSVGFTNFKSIIEKVRSNLDSYIVTKNQRYDTSTLNLNPPSKFSLGVVKFDPHDLAKKTVKETTVNNQQTGPARHDIDSIKTYDPNDILKTTKKETTSFNEQRGHPKSEINNSQIYNPNDILNRTHREETLFNENVLNSRADVNKSLVYDPNDIPDRTHREETLFNENVLNNRADVNKSLVYDPNDILDRTHREETLFNENVLNNRADVNRSTSYNPNELAKDTIKEINVINERNGNIIGDIKNKSFNPNDIPAKTLKELIVNEFEYGIAQGLINKAVSFNPYDIPAETLKEMIIYNDFIQGANPNNEGGGYLTSHVQVPETLRQLVSILRFNGALGNQAPKDYTAEKNMTIDQKKEKSIQSRNPTNRKHNELPTKSNIGNINLRSNNNIERKQIMDTNNYYNNNYQIPTNYTLKQNNNENNRLDSHLLNQLNDNPYVNNVVFQNNDDIDLDEILCD